MKNWTHFEGDQTKQIYGMYGNVEGFLLTSALFGLDILTPVDDFRLSKKTKSSKTKLVWKWWWNQHDPYCENRLLCLLDSTLPKNQQRQKPDQNSKFGNVSLSCIIFSGGFSYSFQKIKCTLRPYRTLNCKLGGQQKTTNYLPISCDLISWTTRFRQSFDAIGPLPDFFPHLANLLGKSLVKIVPENTILYPYKFGRCF